MIVPIFIKGTTIGDTWLNLMWELYHHGDKVPINAGSYAGATRLEADFCSGVIAHPEQEPIAPILPSTCGFESPTTTEKIQNYFVNYLLDPELESNEHYKYAQWINGIIPMVTRTPKNDYEAERISPLNWCIRHFKNKPHNNHCCIKIGDNKMLGGYDIPYKTEADRLTTPCLQLLDFKIGSDNKLHCHVVYRSWDGFAGWPENMGGFSLLTQYMAALIGNGVRVGSLSWSCLKLHVYDFEIKLLMDVLQRKPE